MHRRIQRTPGAEGHDDERSAARRDTPADAVLALQRSAGNRAVAATLGRFTDARFDSPVPIDYGVAIEEMTSKELKDIAAMLAKGELQADDSELERLADRAREFRDEAALQELNKARQGVGAITRNDSTMGIGPGASTDTAFD